jgi:hypothetical protein
VTVRDKRDGRSTSTVLATGGRLVAVCEWWLVDSGGELDAPALLSPGRYAYVNSVAVTAAAGSAGRWWPPRWPRPGRAWSAARCGSRRRIRSPAGPGRT